MDKTTEQFEVPRITDYGDLVDLTAAQVTGSVLDRDFTAGTPLTEITLS